MSPLLRRLKGVARSLARPSRTEAEVEVLRLRQRREWNPREEHFTRRKGESGISGFCSAPLHSIPCPAARPHWTGNFFFLGVAPPTLVSTEEVCVGGRGTTKKKAWATSNPTRGREAVCVGEGWVKIKGRYMDERMDGWTGGPEGTRPEQTGRAGQEQTDRQVIWGWVGLCGIGHRCAKRIDNGLLGWLAGKLMDGRVATNTYNQHHGQHMNRNQTAGRQITPHTAHTHYNDPDRSPSPFLSSHPARLIKRNTHTHHTLIPTTVVIPNTGGFSAITTPLIPLPVSLLFSSSIPFPIISCSPQVVRHTKTSLYIWPGVSFFSLSYISSVS